MGQGLWRAIEIGLLVVIAVIAFVILSKLDDGGEFSSGSVTGALLKMDLLGFLISIVTVLLVFMRKSASVSLFSSFVLVVPICLYIIDDRAFDFLGYPKSVIGGYNPWNIALASAEIICFIAVDMMRRAKIRP